MINSSEIEKTFLNKLLLVIPEPLTVYRFKKKMALFDKFTRNKTGYLIVIDNQDYTRQNLLLIDLIYDKIQDQYGWPEGTAFARSFSRAYIRTPKNLWHVNMLRVGCLMPEDMINLLETKTLLYGEDVIEKIPFPHDKEEILNIHPGLEREGVKKIANKYSQFNPLIAPETCWSRHNFTVEHLIESLIEERLVKLAKGKKLNGKIKHVHIYGRDGGSGKTQIMYSIMKTCKEKKLPFVYRTGFWKDDAGNYKSGYIKENEPQMVSKWVKCKVPNKRSFVLFLDEVDIDLELVEYMFEEQTGHYLIISAAKEIPDFVNESFEIYDISKEYTFGKKAYEKLLDTLIERSNISGEVCPSQSKEIIINKTRLWNHNSFRRTPTAIVLAASLALAEAIKQKEKGIVKHIQVTPTLAEKWALIAKSPWYQEYADIHDVHAEYLIFDGKTYIEKDPHYHHVLP